MPQDVGAYAAPAIDEYGQPIIYTDPAYAQPGAYQQQPMDYSQQGGYQQPQEGGYQ